MLKSLQIKNYALIQELEMQPAKGLNIITGETGAGKSIMLGAVGLLLGNRADSKALYNDAEKCVIEGVFDVKDYHLKDLFEEEGLDYDELCIIRREISPQNKSRAFINDTPVTLEVLKNIGSRLMDVHSQHETLLLASSDFQMSVVDAYAGNRLIKESYQTIFKEFKKTELEFNELSEKALNSKKEFDYNSYLLKELEDAALKENEQDLLEEELKVLQNAEEIKTRLSLVSDLLNETERGAISALQQAVKSLDQIAGFSDLYKSLKERLESSYIEIKDIAGEAEHEAQSVEFNFQRVDEINERLGLIYHLQQKHQVQTISELINIQFQLFEKVKQVDDLDVQIEQKKDQLNQLHNMILEKGQELRESRMGVSGKIKKEVETLLKEVGMVNASVEITIEPVQPGLTGMDKVNLLFSANKGVAAQELKNVASGGELSRLMLCLKYVIADKTALPVIVFDEIDTGISGEVAIKVGKIMKQMASQHQIIIISHLPQIAALGQSHYFVYKDNTSARTVSKVKRLEQSERILQIARMIGGENPTETAIKNAQELMEL